MRAALERRAFSVGDRNSLVEACCYPSTLPTLPPQGPWVGRAPLSMRIGFECSRTNIACNEVGKSRCCRRATYVLRSGAARWPTGSGPIARPKEPVDARECAEVPKTAVEAKSAIFMSTPACSALQNTRQNFWTISSCEGAEPASTTGPSGGGSRVEILCKMGPEVKQAPLPDGATERPVSSACARQDLNL